MVDRIKQLLPQLQASLPGSVKVAVLTDRTTTIRASVKDVQFELMLAVALVVLVIFLFLRTLAATVIPASRCRSRSSAPSAVMYAARLQPQQPLADGAHHLHRLRGGRRHRHDREHRALHRGRATRRCEAALKGSEQIGFTILSLTVSLIAVLIPLLFMGDVVGRLFREFAITLGVTILISAVVSLTLTPMMCARLLRHHEPHEQQGRLYRALRARRSTASSPSTARRCAWVLEPPAGDPARGGRHARAHRPALRRGAQGLLPGPGHRRHPGHLGGAADRSRSRRWPSGSRRWPAAILQDPAVESLSSFIGVDGTNVTLNSGRILITLKPLDERGIERERRHPSGCSPQLAEVRRHHALPAAGAGPHRRGPGEPHPVPVHPGGPERAPSSTPGRPRLVERLRALPELRDVASDQQDQGLETLDRDRPQTPPRASASRPR